MYDIAIVGGGIIGAATAYQLQSKYPDLDIILFEKEERFANHQTGNNSGVIHSGLYYTPGSSKAKYCVAGRHELVAFAKEHKIAHDICGKVVVATDESELPHLNKIFDNGIANNTEGIRKINGEEIKEIEPFVEGVAGIHVPCTGIIDFRGTTEKLVEIMDQTNESSHAKLGYEVLSFKQHEDHTDLHTNKGDFQAKHVIFCGGLHSDRLAVKDKLDLDMQIVGFRGDYYDLTEKGKHKVKHLIYPVPNPQFPFLGVHFTRMTDGSIECGPNAVFSFKREGYNRTDFDWKDTKQALGFSGTRKLMMKHWQFGLTEYRRAFSKKLFLETLQRLIPSLEMDDIKPGRAGVRAQALHESGDLIQDFRIEYKDKHIHVLNAPSPAATACLAIGRGIMEEAEKRFKILNN